MERNSVIAERLEKSVLDKLPRTRKSERLSDEVYRQEREFLKLIEGDEQLVKKYLDIEGNFCQSQFEYESMCFCDGVRIGFKLCMDIFEI